MVSSDTHDLDEMIAQRYFFFFAQRVVSSYSCAARSRSRGVIRDVLKIFIRGRNVFNIKVGAKFTIAINAVSLKNAKNIYIYIYIYIYL